MSIEHNNIYPNCSYVIRAVQLGTDTKANLYHKLNQEGIQLNPFAEQLFDDKRFLVSATPHSIETIELQVKQLGCLEGATMPQIFDRAKELGLRLCSLEVGPQLRLQYTEQTEGAVGKPATKNRAPFGSLTIISSPIAWDHDFPKGFYLRTIEGELWLRGYSADFEHVFSPEDTLIFCR